MEKLTNQEKARVFAMYYPLKAVSTIYKSTTYSNQAAIEDILKGEEYIVLPLTPLQAITDEHAIEVAKIFNDEYEWEIKERDKMCIVGECKDYIMWLYFDDSSLIDFEKKIHRQRKY